MKNHSETLEKLLEKVIERKNGNRVRHLTRIISNAYSENSEELKQYFNDNTNQFITGIATSAYHFLTGDIGPILEKDFGGFGAIVDNSEEGLEFNNRQLWHSKISGDSLRHSKNKGNALRYSENSGNALWKSKNRGHSLESSNNKGDALWKSNNKGDALSSSKNSKHSLGYSENSERALEYSKNRGYTLWKSNNKGYALKDSKISGDALWYSENSENALEGSKRSLFNRIFVRFNKE